MYRLIKTELSYLKSTYNALLIAGNPNCAYIALCLLMANSPCNHSIHNLDVELSLIFRAYFSSSTTATRGKHLLEECKISSFYSPVAIHFPDIKYKRRSL